MTNLLVTVIFVYINLCRISIFISFFFVDCTCIKNSTFIIENAEGISSNVTVSFFKIAMYVKNTWLKFLWHGVSARFLYSSKTLGLFVSRQGNIKHLVQHLAFCTIENFFEIFLKIKIFTKKNILWNIKVSIYLVLYLKLLNHFFPDRLQVACLFKWNYNDKNLCSPNLEIFLKEFYIHAVKLFF